VPVPRRVCTQNGLETIREVNWWMNVLNLKKKKKKNRENVIVSLDSCEKLFVDKVRLVLCCRIKIVVY
jgi:P pilus assembly chaperone PapD